MNSDSLNMVSRLGEGHMPWTFFLSEPQLKTTVDPREGNPGNVLLTSRICLQKFYQCISPNQGRQILSTIAEVATNIFSLMCPGPDKHLVWFGIKGKE